MRYLLTALLIVSFYSSLKAQSELFEMCQYFKTRSVGIDEQLKILGTPQITRQRPTYLVKPLGVAPCFIISPPIGHFYLNNNMIVHYTAEFDNQVVYVLSRKDILKKHGPGKSVKSLPECAYSKQMAYLKGKGVWASEREGTLHIEENGHYSIAYRKNLLGRFKAVAIII